MIKRTPYVSNLSIKKTKKPWFPHAYHVITYKNNNNKCMNCFKYRGNWRNFTGRETMQVATDPIAQLKLKVF